MVARGVLRTGALPFSLLGVMQEQAPTGERLAFRPERLGKVAFVADVLKGIGIMLGLALLWLLESVRNVFFRALDRLNIRPRPRRASAFPPGSLRKRATGA
jgi:hypothetical protein